MQGSHQPLLVLLSLVVATGASYTALLLADRLAGARPARRLAWLGAGALALGTGIWSMHFIGMLAFELPIAVGYDRWLTFLSWLLALKASFIALYLTLRDPLPPWRGTLGAIVIGGGISEMHYEGMAALRMLPAIEYRDDLFAASIGIAIATSGAAIVILRALQRRHAGSRLAPAAAALVMGIAITGMHYTAMAAARFAPGTVCGALADGLGPDNLVATVTVGALGLLTLGALLAEFDRQSHHRRAAHARSMARAQAEIHRLSARDPLTGLPNRRRLERRLRLASLRARREQGRLALLHLNLDGFHAVNDGLGHAVGDALLRDVAADLAAQCGAGRRDSRADAPGREPVRPAGGCELARPDGDDFLLLWRDPPGADAVIALAGALLGAVRRPRVVAGHELRVTASIGIALQPDHADADHELRVRADAAMQAAKRAGRDCHVVYDASLTPVSADMLRLQGELLRALAANELELFLQPKIGTRDARVTSAEALLRWRHPRRGLLGPGDFLPVAECFGLVNAIGDWVIEAGCALASRLADRGRVISVAVNLSATQFRQPDLARRIGEAMRRHRIDGSALVIEITESSAIADPVSFVARLGELRALGVDVALDDFGTGYSSLSYLRLVRARQLKLDRAFVQDIASCDESRLIVEAILRLAGAIGMKTVAEGIETEAQARALTELGCDELQGYLYSVPLAEADFLAWLDAREHLPDSLAAPPRLRSAARPEADTLRALNRLSTLDAGSR
ncbi:putative bifunctional diguanylate cyclase/phosphodiesterase [Derxia gummosa]|uniref:Bifunctional diguanylate cyclase/phosphodiesterase n=1 Tax=Derxia gummosa DSM 723 TaxID=1121388 RepID=A0A8B6X9U3_9BURK|nr:EAL domain-containing protein [Derxia gummosa]